MKNKKEYLYKIVNSENKKSVIKVYSENDFPKNELKKELKKIYLNQIKDKSFNGVIKVYDTKENDISNTREINKIVWDILKECNKKEVKK